MKQEQNEFVVRKTIAVALVHSAIFLHSIFFFEFFVIVASF